MVSFGSCRCWQKQLKRFPKKKKRESLLTFQVPKTAIDSMPEWLEKVMTREKGYDPKLMITRTFCKTDLDKVQACLSMPFNSLKNSDFFTEEENRFLDEHSATNERIKDGMKVMLVDSQSNKHLLDLRKRNVKGSQKYIFNNGWNLVVDNNEFHIGDVTEIWSFRYGQGKLGFALSPVTRSSVKSSSRPSSSKS